MTQLTPSEQQWLDKRRQRQLDLARQAQPIIVIKPVTIDGLDIEWDDNDMLIVQ